MQWQVFHRCYFFAIWHDTQCLGTLVDHVMVGFPNKTAFALTWHICYHSRLAAGIQNFFHKKDKVSPTAAKGPEFGAPGGLGRAGKSPGEVKARSPELRRRDTGGSSGGPGARPGKSPIAAELKTRSPELRRRDTAERDRTGMTGKTSDSAADTRPSPAARVRSHIPSAGRAALMRNCILCYRKAVATSVRIRSNVKKIYARIRTSVAEPLMPHLPRDADHRPKGN